MRLFDGMDLRLINFTHGDERVSFRDWHETATVLTGLRLLVTVDTAVAHLAGAMGIPVWLLLPYVPDWRWMHHDEAGYNSPWYPTMLLYRQPRKGDWQSVFDYVLRSLKYKEIYR